MSFRLAQFLVAKKNCCNFHILESELSKIASMILMYFKCRGMRIHKKINTTLFHHFLKINIWISFYHWPFIAITLSMSRPSVTLFLNVPVNVSSWNFQELLPLTKVVSITIKVKGQRSRSQRSKPKLFVSGPPVWIHIRQRNDAQNWMWHRRGALLFFKVICQISRSHATKTRWFWSRLGVSGL